MADGEDREAEPRNNGIDVSYGNPTMQFRLKIDGRVALGALGLAAFYFSSPENQAKVAAALSKALERVGEKIVNIASGSLVVVLHCSRSELFLMFWDDYQSGSVKKRLLGEFSEIGIEEATVEIENEEEVLKMSKMFR